MERTEDLLLNGLKIYQDDELYCFTSDAVLLSKFATVKKGDVVADFCSGSGIVGIHLYGLNAAKIASVTLFEMQKSLFDLSVKSIRLNGLENVFFAENVKVQNIPEKHREKFSLIVANPPYAQLNSGFVTEKREFAVCRAEIELTLEELIGAAAFSLKFGGRFCMVNRADRLAEICYTLKKYNLEPKRLQLISGKENKPYLLLIESVKGGKKGITVYPQKANL